MDDDDECIGCNKTKKECMTDQYTSFVLLYGYPCVIPSLASYDWYDPDESEDDDSDYTCKSRSETPTESETDSEEENASESTSVYTIRMGFSRKTVTHSLSVDMHEVNGRRCAILSRNSS